MEKGKLLFCLGEEEDTLPSSTSFSTPPLAAIISETPQPDRLDQTTAIDAMQFWRDVNSMLDSLQRDEAYRKAHSNSLCVGDGPNLVKSDGKRSEDDLLSKLFDKDKLTSASASLPKVMIGGETSKLMSSLPLVANNMTSNSNEAPSIRSSSSKPEPPASSSIESSALLTRKIYSNEELSELARLDPKKAKRIMTNRVSAARCKEKKKRQMSELEQKVLIMQIETISLAAKVTTLQKHKSTLTFENRDLKLRLQGFEQLDVLQEELAHVLEAEVQRLQLERNASSSL